MTKKERYNFIINYFERNSPDAETELHYQSTYELLTAVILSAQCTDKRVNLTTPKLFKKYPTLTDLAHAEVNDVFDIIKSISYPNNKAKHLVGMAQKVIEEYDGQIPMTVKELMTLPGVGRKTANVVTSVVDEQPNMAVDTHVFRVSARIGLTTNAKTPLQTELQLIKYLPKDLIHKAHHWLILHGRYVCIARKPKCNQCKIQQACKYYEKISKQESI
ncbi:MAG: endonuclease III [Chitinophagaceae bacterium]